MRYSKIIQASEKGFSIDAHLLKPIGISNNSHCWGILLENHQDDDQHREGEQGRDLIISSLPYRSWACMVRMQIRVKNDALIEKLKEIYEILFTEDRRATARLMIDFGTPCHQNRFAARRIDLAPIRPASASTSHYAPLLASLRLPQ